MSAAELIDILKRDGIEIRVREGRLGLVATSGRITDKHKALVRDHKTALVAIVDAVPGKQNCGSCELAEPQAFRPIPSVNGSTGDAFKEYRMPDGAILQVSKDEFARVIEVFRMLHLQKLKLSEDGGAGVKK